MILPKSMNTTNTVTTTGSAKNLLSLYVSPYRPQHSKVTNTNASITSNDNNNIHTKSFVQVRKPTDKELKQFCELYIRQIQFTTIATNIYEPIEQYDNRTLYVQYSICLVQLCKVAQSCTVHCSFLVHVNS